MRKARLDEASALAKLAENVMPFAWSQQQFSDSLQQHEVYVIEQDGAIVAFLVYHIIKPEMELLNIAVCKTMQRQGLAKLLINKLISNAKSALCQSILLEVRESNSMATGLYRQYGFEMIASRANYYPGRNNARETARVMRLQL